MTTTPLLSKHANFVIGWIIVTIALIFGLLIHSWTTRHTKQPFLLLCVTGIALAQFVSLPYTWDLKLQRYRNLLNALLHIVAALILLVAYVA